MQDPIRSAFRELQCAVRENVPLAPLTHVRIGGPATILLEPFAETDVAGVVRICREEDRKLRVLGGGSNLLVDDAGVALVLSLSSLNRMVREGNRLTAGAGVSLPTLLSGARKAGLSGLETLTGIPAAVGGAVRMNAGTRDGETFDHLVSLTVVDSDGEIRVLGKDDFQPEYRDGGLGEMIVLHATFELSEDDPQAIYRRFEESLKRRNATQPVSQRSVGCVFRNPEGGSAGQLIEAAGCKLMHRGGVRVSAKHANYFVNEGEGTSADFLALVGDVQERVQADAGVALELEVQLWGGSAG